MRKLEPIKNDALKFTSDIISSSRKKGIDSEESKRKTDEFRKKCSGVLSINEQTIKEYDDDFASDSLEKLENKGQLNDEKDDFLSLYSYNKKQIAQLRDAVLTQNGYRDDSCPLCECDSVSTMDHYLPKDKYTLFVVHPRNLIPCCAACNEQKSDNVFESGKRKYWNCYLDNPVDKKYLRCRVIKKENGLIDAEFTIDKSELSEQEAYILENTLGHNGQNVLGQYKKMVGSEISELVKRISGLMQNENTFDDSIRKIKEVDLANCVVNDWKDVLKEALLNSDDFLELAKTEAEKIARK